MQAFFMDIAAQLRELLWPKNYLAWQTLLLLSIYSILTGAALDYLLDPNGIDPNQPEPFIIHVFSTLSWCFFTTAVWWKLSEDPVKIYGFSISPWITGSVLCIFFFRPWTPARFRLALSCWPVLSTGVMALPNFVGWELKLKKIKDKDARKLVMTLLVNLLLTSWILFHFRVQDWVSNYPSLLINGLENSQFVYDFAGDERNQQSQGVPLLESTAAAVAQELDDQPWYQTERWLFNRQVRMERISQRMLGSLYAPNEQTFWNLVVPVPRRLEDGYLLTFRANWLGPVAKDDAFYLEKSCRIMPVDRVRAVPVEEDQPVPTSRVTRVTCEEELPEVKWVTSETQ